MTKKYEKRMELIKKYNETIAFISANNKSGDHNPDEGVSLDMLIANYRAKQSGKPVAYKMPEWTDEQFTEFGKDYDEVLAYELAF